MEHIEEISCIKDGVTGVCRDIKDKKARASIEALEKTVNTLAGVDGGHLATDEDVEKKLDKPTDEELTASGDFAIGFSATREHGTAPIFIDKPKKYYPIATGGLVGVNKLVTSDGNGLIQSNDPINELHLANKRYVDNAVANAGGGGGGACLGLVATLTGNPEGYEGGGETSYTLDNDSLYKIVISGWCSGSTQRFTNYSFDFPTFSGLDSNISHVVKQDNIITDASTYVHWELKYDVTTHRFIVEVKGYYPGESHTIRIYKYNI